MNIIGKQKAPAGHKCTSNGPWLSGSEFGHLLCVSLERRTEQESGKAGKGRNQSIKN